MPLTANKPLNADSEDAQTSATVNGYIFGFRKQGFDDLEIAMFLKQSLPSQYHKEIERQTAYKG